MNWRHYARAFKYDQSNANNKFILSTTLWLVKSPLLWLSCSCLSVTLLEFISIWYFRFFCNYVQSEERTWRFSVILILVTGLIRSTQCFAQKIYNRGASQFTVNVQSLLLNAIYQKILRLSKFVDWSGSSIQQLIHSPVQQITDFTAELHCLAASATSVIICLCWLCNLFGIVAFGSLSLLLCLLVIRAYVLSFEHSTQKRYIESKHKVLLYMSDKFKHMSLIKLYCWENAIQKQTMELRRVESKHAVVFLILSAVQNFFSYATPFLIQVSCLAYMYFTSFNIDKLNISNVYCSMMLFRETMRSMDNLLVFYNQLKQARYGSKKLEILLLAEEAESASMPIQPRISDETYISNGQFKWNRKCLTPILDNVSIKISPGKLTCIISETGKGKSALLYSIARETHMTTGDVLTPISYAILPQQTWIKSSSVRRNIVLHKSFRSKQYDKVLEACSLKHDLLSMEDGDSTYLYDQGSNLSGGQKQRICIARAVYHDKELYLFDDSLSMLDARTADHVFKQVISNEGMLSETTRIFATHNVKFLQYADEIIAVCNGTIQRTNFSEYLKENDRLLTSEDFTSQEQQENDRLCEGNLYDYDYANSTDDNDSFSKEPSYISQQNLNLKNCWPILAGVIGFSIGELLKVNSEFSMAKWATNMKWDNVLAQSQFNLFVSCALGQCFIFLITSACCSVQLRKFFDALYEATIRSLLLVPLSFHMKNPAIEIMDRLSDDFERLDTQFPANFRALLVNVMNALTSLLISVISCPIFALPVASIMIFYSYLQRSYRESWTNAYREKLSAFCIVLVKLNEAVEGRLPIRSFQIAKECSAEFQHSLDVYCDAVDQMQRATSWLRMNLNSAVTVLVMILSASALFNLINIDPAYFCILLSNVLSISYLMELTSRSWQGAQTYLQAFDRIKEYANLKPESRCEQFTSRHNDLAPTFFHVKAGHISFKNFSARYHGSLKPVLNQLNLDILPGQRFGVVGRTGAGKSSLTLALSGFLEQIEGTIEIDSFDIRHVDLSDLRSNVVVVSQEPMIFDDTLRNNLDPQKIYSDERIWDLLDRVNLKDVVTRADGQLDALVGGNQLILSHGQRQLLCVVRALLKCGKILILDEATASVDSKIEAIIWEVLNAICPKSTIIVIAHKIQNILNCNCAAVMEDGCITECGNVNDLLADEKSKFYDLYHLSLRKQ